MESKESVAGSEQECWIRLDTNAPWNDSGEGLFATREIEKGHLVYTEFPETIVNHLDPKHKVDGDGIDLLYFYRSSLNREEYEKRLKYTLLGKNTATILVKKRRGGIIDWATEFEMLNVKPTWVNHSCIPNMYRIDSNDLITGRLKCQFFALKDISEGDELTIAYEDVVGWECVSARRALLGKEHRFFCRCVRCAEESELRDMEPLRPAHMNVSLQMRRGGEQMDGAEDEHNTSRPVKNKGRKQFKLTSEHELQLGYSKASNRSFLRAHLKFKSLLEDLRDIFDKGSVARDPVTPRNSLERSDEEEEGTETAARSGLALFGRGYNRRENRTF